MPHPFDNPETLLRERQWLRAFARALVRDAGAADDLTQDALLAAARRRRLLLLPLVDLASLCPWRPTRSLRPSRPTARADSTPRSTS